MTHDAGAACNGAPLRLARAISRRGSARRGGRGGHGGESAGLSGRQTWRRGDKDSGGCGVAVMGNTRATATVSYVRVEGSRVHACRAPVCSMCGDVDMAAVCGCARRCVCFVCERENENG
eukprot:scaffold1424_cov111-Isochrysis_galbana.AAC.8